MSGNINWATLSEPGASTNGIIPLCAPHISGRAWDYVRECLDSGWVSSVGPFVERFEQAVADYVGVKHAVAVASGTAALHTALIAAGVGPEDEVLVPAMTFIATANAIRYTGAYPVFIDVDAQHWQLCPDRLAEFLSSECCWSGGFLRNKVTQRLVKAILPVHILGHPADMDPILELADRFGLIVIEDAAEALGAKYKGKHVGTLGQIGCLSFNGNKLITCGGGGMLLTNDAKIASFARYLTTQAKDDPIEYVHSHVGYNYRLTNLQAALGLSQLEQIAGFIAAKRRITAAYLAALAGTPGISSQRQAEWAFSTCWLFTAEVDPHTYGATSRDLLARLQQRGIQARPLWQPLHRSPSMKKLPDRNCPVADRLHERCLSLPSSVGLKSEEQQRVVDAIVESRTSRRRSA